jgi:hypothetical protein
MSLLSPLPNDILRFEIVQWLTPPWRVFLFEALTGWRAKQILVREYAEEICRYGETLSQYARDYGLILAVDLRRAALFYGWRDVLSIQSSSFGWVLHAALGNQMLLITKILPKCKMRFSYYELFQIYILTKNSYGLLKLQVFWDQEMMIRMSLAFTMSSMYLWLLDQLNRKPHINDLILLLNVSRDIKLKRRKYRASDDVDDLSPTTIHMSGHADVFEQYNINRPSRLKKFLELFKSFGMEPSWNMITNFDDDVIMTLIDLDIGIPNKGRIIWMISHDVMVAITLINKYHKTADLSEYIQLCIEKCFDRGLIKEVMKLIKLGGRLTPELYLVTLVRNIPFLIEQKVPITINILEQFIKRNSISMISYLLHENYIPMNLYPLVISYLVNKQGWIHEIGWMEKQGFILESWMYSIPGFEKYLLAHEIPILANRLNMYLENPEYAWMKRIITYDASLQIEFVNYPNLKDIQSFLDRMHRLYIDGYFNNIQQSERQVNYGELELVD